MSAQNVGVPRPLKEFYELGFGATSLGMVAKLQRTALSNLRHDVGCEADGSQHRSVALLDFVLLHRSKADTSYCQAGMTGTQVGN